MRYLLQRTRLQHLIRHRNGYLALAGCAMGLNILLVILLFSMIGREKIVVVPPEIQKSFWVTSSKVSPEYLSEMVMFLNSLYLNVTPSNAAMQHTVLLHYVDPSVYEKIKVQLITMQDRLKKEHVTLSFQPSHIKVDNQKLMAEVSGDLQYTVGSILLTPRPVIYHWGFNYQQGRLRITSFPEEKQNV